MMTYAEKVERGIAGAIAYLDEYGPEGWRDRVDPDRLRMMSWRWCVLGQAYEGVIEYPAEDTGAYRAALALISQDIVDHPERAFPLWVLANNDDEWRRQLDPEYTP